MSRVDALLAAIPGDLPAGPDLAYDPAFHELETSARGRPERQMGAEVIPAEPPDWRAVMQAAEALLARAKDLRVAIVWCQARTAVDGLAGLADGCELLDGLLRDFWQGAHPQLDPEDGDSTMRANALAALGDTAGMVNAVRRVALLPANPLGQFSLRDLDVAAGRLVPAGPTQAAPPSQALIDSAVEACEGAALAAELDAVSRADAAVTSLSRRLEAQLGPLDAPDLSALAAVVRHARDSLGRWVEARGLGNSDSGAAQESKVAAAPDSQADRHGAQGAEIRTREDVITTLDHICAYYARFEPSSPVPLLLERAKGLVSKDFLAILADLSPATLEQVTNITRPAKGEE